MIVLSPLLSDDVAEALAELTRSGRAMLVVDTLPSQITVPDESEWTELAWRIQMLHRENLVAALPGRGVPLVPWLGGGSLDAVLRGLAKLATVPRAVGR